jgi:hypothetical protein
MGWVNNITDSLGITNTERDGSLLDQGVKIVSNAVNDIGTAVVEHPLETAALVAAAFVAPELIAAMGSEAAAAEAAIGLSEAEQLALASQVAAEAELGGVAGSAAIGAEALPAVLPEPPEEWTPPENLPPADTPTGIDAEGAQPPISTDQTDEIYKKLDSVKKQIANDLVKKGIPLSSAVQYANGLGQTSSPSAQIIQQPQQTTSGGTTLSPLSPQYLTSTANKQGFVNPLSTYQKMVASDTQPLQQTPAPTQDTVQVSQGNVMPDYYSYGQNQSIDDILGITAKEGGLVTPLMAKGGSVQKYAEGGLSIPLMNHGGKMRGDFRHGAHVAGPGDGQSDDIPAMLADGEFVFSADVVSALGNGSTKAGSDKLYEMMHAIRARARLKGPKDLPPPALKSPLDYLSKKSRS